MMMRVQTRTCARNIYMHGVLHGNEHYELAEVDVMRCLNSGSAGLVIWIVQGGPVRPASVAGVVTD